MGLNITTIFDLTYKEKDINGNQAPIKKADKSQTKKK